MILAVRVNVLKLLRISVDVYKRQEEECAALDESLKSFEEILRREFSVTDPGISITVAGKEQGEWEAFTKESTEKAEMLLFMMPNGIQAMSADIKGLVQTSLNLGILKMADGVLELDYSVRSSVMSEKQMIIDKVCLLLESQGGTYEISGDYPAWEYRQDSALRDKMVEIYEEMYGNCLLYTSMRDILSMARRAGRKIMELVEKDIRPDKILTPAAFRNAIVIHSAIGGSTNALLHLPAIAGELGIELDPELFNEINQMCIRDRIYTVCLTLSSKLNLYNILVLRKLFSTLTVAVLQYNSNGSNLSELIFKYLQLVRTKGKQKRAEFIFYLYIFHTFVSTQLN